MNLDRRWLMIAAWLSIAAVIVVTVLPIGLRPTTPWQPNTERFFVMATVGWMFVLAYPARFWTIVLFLISAAVVIEPLQFFAAGRHPSSGDAIIKASGGAAGAIAGDLILRAIVLFKR